MSKHPIVHIELSAKDLGEAAGFYSEVFNWQIQDVPEMNYTMFAAEGGPAGGFNPVSDQVKAGTVMIYIATDDIEASLAKVAANGGQTVVPKTEIPNMGWFAMFSDPTGNTVGLFAQMEGQG